MQFLAVAVVTVLFLLLAMSMAHHHFLRGEMYERNHPTDR